MKTLLARVLAGLLVAAAAGTYVFYSPDEGDDRVGDRHERALLTKQSLDPDSAFFRGEYETASALYRVLALAGRDRPPGRHAELGVVRSLIAMGRFDGAERYIRRLDEDTTRTRTLTTTDAHLLICLRSEIFTRRAEIPLAVQYAADCRQRVRPQHQPDPLVRWYALYVTAFAYAEADRFNIAISHYLDALDVLAESGRTRSPEYARTINHIANMHYRTGSFTLSRRLHEEALNLRLDLFHDEHPAVAASFGNIGNVLHAMGDFESALSHHRRALSIWTRSLGAAHPQTAYSLNNIGFALNRLDRFDEAEYFLLRAAELKTRVLSGSSLSLARTHRNLADAYLGQGNTHLARRYADRALAAVAESGHEQDVLASQALVTLAAVLRSEGRSAEALDALLDARNRAFEQNHPYAVVVMNVLAGTLLEEERSRDALRTTEQAITYGSNDRARFGRAVSDRFAALEAGRSSHPVLAESHRLRAAAHLQLFQKNADEHHLEAAKSEIRHAANVLGESPLIRSDFSMSGYLTDGLTRIASTGLDIALETWNCGCGNDPIRDALTFSDMYKNGFEYTDRLLEASRSEKDADPAGRRLDSLQLELFEARRSRAVLELEHAATPRRTVDLDSRAFRIERQIRSVRRSMRTGDSGGLFEAFDPGPLHLAELPKDLLVADFVLLEDRIIVVAFAHGGGAIHRIDRTAQLNALFETYPDVVRGSDSALFVNHARTLYEQLLEPLGMDSGIERLLVSPHDILWDIPVESLLTEDADAVPLRDSAVYGRLPFLILKQAVSYCRSGASFLKARASVPDIRTSPAPRRILAAAPGFDYEHSLSTPVREFLALHGYSHVEADRHTALSGSLSEVKHLETLDINARIYDHIELLYDGDATEVNVKSRLTQPFNIIHIATHGYASSNAPSFAGILLSHDPDSHEDGVLYAEELHHIRLEAGLVILSACYSGYSNGGEKMESRFIQSLSTTSINNLFVSLWPIMDVSSSKLMTDIHTYIRDGYSVEMSLQMAKINAIHGTPEMAHPAVWAPFVHVSNSRFGQPVV